MVWSSSQFIVSEEPGEIPPLVHQVVADIHFTVPEDYVLGVGDIDYFKGSEGLAARIYTFRDVQDAYGYWGVKPVYITVYCEDEESSTVGIDITNADGVLLTVAGYGEDSDYRDRILERIERVLREI